MRGRPKPVAREHRRQHNRLQRALLPLLTRLRPLTPPTLRAQAALAPLQVSYGKSQAWTLEVTVNYLEVADIDTLTTGAGVYTANAFTDGITLDGTFSAWRGGRAMRARWLLGC